MCDVGYDAGIVTTILIINQQTSAIQIRLKIWNTCHESERDSLGADKDAAVQVWFWSSADEVSNKLFISRSNLSFTDVSVTSCNRL